MVSNLSRAPRLQSKGDGNEIFQTCHGRTSVHRTNTAVRSVSRSASDEYPAMTLDGHQESVRMGVAASCPVLDPLIPILADMVRLIMSAERFMTGATSSHERRDTDNDSVVNDM
jgi:hypothetical protein